MSVINLDDVRYAKGVINKSPLIVQKLDSCINLLYNDRYNMDVSEILNQIYVSKSIILIELEACRMLIEQAKES